MVGWDDYFMNLVYLLAMRSKDASTRYGAVIVNNNNRIISTGYNGFAQGINDNVPERQERPEKYFWFIHAELNAIINAKTDTEGFKMYVNGMPCTGCANAIINAGLKKVIIDSVWDKPTDKWDAEFERVHQLFFEAKIEIIYWKGELINLYRFKRGEKF